MTDSKAGSKVTSPGGKAKSQKAQTLGRAERTIRGLTSAGRYARTLTKPALKKRSAAEAALVLDWEKIVGKDIASRSRPRKLTFPTRKERRAGHLTLLVDPAFALDLQHLSTQLMDRINSHFGFQLVARLLVHQGPLTSTSQSPPKRLRQARPDDKKLTKLNEDLQEVADDGLRQALERLGTSVLSAEAAKGKHRK
ncbi:DUF721 domain-containing protein [Rhodovibrionaceae bacterium A322]